MLRKIYGIIVLVALFMVLLEVPALAVEPGEERVTLGANLTEEQITQMYTDFDVERGEVTEISVTIEEERAYLSGLVPDERIGSSSISSIYIKTLEEDSGINVTTNNINWCTEDIYRNALMTAGIENASVMVSAPFKVSGTAALTGIYKAYEDITGTSLDQTAKEVATEELVTTSELAETIGSDDATMLMNELKKILDETKDMTDDELRAVILSLADAQNIELTEENIQQIINLSRTLEKLDISEWGDKLSQLAETMDNAKEAGKGITSFLNGLEDFFAGVSDFFANIFGGIEKIFGS
ncbi:conserved exported protein of unknown function [Petrocella atlantisensis]|uniref:DUF1002 domain-containing protein n=1 Tax=Petrocella atlantisensis TaxID=2173034 RepID=A0A3P7PE73_9FIRM|nr:DUF1002 domain-containing protein [Petrocella atlantisensis]VDN48373.1 conserved exported protein of unknown function [Petrocella atlantisensis]